MSDDFISRKALMEKAMQEEYDNDIHKYGRAKAIHHGEYQHFYKTISEMPTAYDADKVVEEMKKVEKETLVKTEELYKNLNISPQAIFAASNSALVMLGKCIEIVKSGGVSDD